jgi:hypothetical protein
LKQHPFNEGSKLAKIYTILSDQKWHCGKHELPGTQPAKAIQIMRQHGFQIVNETKFCQACKDKTVHRRLTSVKPVAASFVRLQIPRKLRERVLKHYKNTEAITLREMIPNLLEVDHRFPQVRWSRDEQYNPNMSESELHQRFQLLTREHNLWKSRYCEHCRDTGERGPFIGINYFAAGEKTWDSKIPKDDPKGCEGCFWYNPSFWRQELNAALEKKA